MALHAGVATAVTFRRIEGPLRLAQAGAHAALSDLTVARTDAGVALTNGHGLTIDLVEHALAAAAGLGIRHALEIDVEGPELPLLDGGSRAFANALVELDLPRAPPELVIVL